MINRDKSDPQVLGQHLICGIQGVTLTTEEMNFLKKYQPAGVILFARNLENITQIEQLIYHIRQISPQPITLWLDQEGGRVQRIRSPLMHHLSAGRLYAIWQENPEVGLELCYLSGLINAQELQAVGFDVNCAPVLDILTSGADPVIGDRAFADNPEQVIQLAGAWLKGFQSVPGCIAVGKHFPGHGRAMVDSHKALPTITVDWETLLKWELKPFQALLPSLPILMTAHIRVTSLDDQPATTSEIILQKLLRQQWMYSGLIASDALEMQALEGDMVQRAKRALIAGCDLLLCCTGDLEDSKATIEGIREGYEAQSSEAFNQSRLRIQTLRQGVIDHTLKEMTSTQLLQNSDYKKRRARLMSFQTGSGGKSDPTEVLQTST
ncbi:beta-N-acetylhexosaminidase [Magnetococcales bacterium HHB-1]